MISRFNTQTKNLINTLSLLPRKICLTFFQEGSGSFFKVFGSKTVSKLFYFYLKTIYAVFKICINSFNSSFNSNRRVSHYFAGYFFGKWQQFFLGGYMVYQSIIKRSIRIYHASSHNQFHSTTFANQLW